MNIKLERYSQSTEEKLNISEAYASERCKEIWKNISSLYEASDFVEFCNSDHPTFKPYLSSFEFLTKSIHICFKGNAVNDDASIVLSFQQVEELNMAGCRLVLLIDKFLRMPNLKKLDVSNNLIFSDIAFDQSFTYIGLRYNSPVQTLLMQSHHFTSPSLFRITHLNISCCNLEHLPETLLNMKDMQELIAYDNRLEQIPNDLFKLTKMFHLDLSKNMIEKLPSNIKYMEKLQNLYISRNSIKIIPDEISELKNLTNLCADHNIIDSISSIIFPDSLKYVNLSGNKLKLAGCTNLMEIVENLSMQDMIFNVDANHMLNIAGPPPTNLTRLKTFSLRGSNYYNVPGYIFRMKNLTELNLSCCYLPNLEQCNVDLPNLKVLDMSKTGLTNLSEALFNSLKNLEQINLSQNQIDKIPECIYNLNLLEIIDVSNNRINSVSHKIFGLKLLKFLSLQQNAILQIDNIESVVITEIVNIFRHFKE
ncbi:Leucine-rich repeat-containing protein 1 [Nymphon striatum]|nr:Leucine-rich repeat-containing protein 1 [Nymphon striatum]